jgi:hypothetical protein
MKINNLSYKIAEQYIEEGDVLLFRGKGILSKIIQSFSNGPHSHVAVASWHKNHDNDEIPPILECIEFREFHGGRTTSLEIQVCKYSGLIDVYRPNPKFYGMFYNSVTQSIQKTEYKFNGRAVTNCMRRMTGLPYGYNRIIYLAKLKLAGFKLFFNYNDLIIDSVGEVIYPVCSTALSHCFNSSDFDIVKNKSDEYTEPSDFSRSCELNYLFTLNG